MKIVVILYCLRNNNKKRIQIHLAQMQFVKKYFRSAIEPADVESGDTEVWLYLAFGERY